ncbi:MAG: hypothetical protein Q3995_07965 [Eubacteriales bacterium]|nr:hypothetical protein [Eubacteriales bacterium]
MDQNPEVAKKHKKTIQNFPHFTSESEAIKAADKMNESSSLFCQVWAKVDKDEEYYHIQDYYIVTDDNLILQAAEYIGMAHIYTA